MDSFRKKFLKGELRFSDVNKYIDHWHLNLDLKISLHEYLGFNKEEYINLIKKPHEIEKRLIEERNGKRYYNS